MNQVRKLCMLLSLSVMGQVGLVQPLHAEDDAGQAGSPEWVQGCSAGSPGWWITLDTSPTWDSVAGGIYTSSGSYYGCGTCDSCRKQLNELIDRDLASFRQSCAQRGGVVKSESRGNWTENVQSTAWSMRSDQVSIVCEKWVPCSLE